MCCLVVAGNKSQREELDSILFIFEVSTTVFYSSETASAFFCGVTLQLHLLLRTVTPRTNSFVSHWAICLVPVCAWIVVLTSAVSALMSNGHSKEPHPVSPECTGCTSSANVHPHLHLSKALGCHGDNGSKTQWAVSLFLFVHSVFSLPIFLELCLLLALYLTQLGPF